MSGVRGLVPAVMAIGVGIFTGYYAFKPAFQELDVERRTKNQSQFQVVNVNSNISSTIAPSTATPQSDTPTETRETSARPTK